MTQYESEKDMPTDPLEAFVESMLGADEDEQVIATAKASDIYAKMGENLQAIAGHEVKHEPVTGKITRESAKTITKNAIAESLAYQDYLAGDTASLVRDHIDFLHELLEDEAFAGADAETMNAMVIDSIQKLVHQEIESNRQQFTDHGIRHIVGNIKRQDAIATAMNGGKPVDARTRLMASMAMINHDIGYTTPLVREGGLRGIMVSGQHPKMSASILAEQKDQWNSDKVFSADEFSKMVDVVATHDSTQLDASDIFGTSVRLSDNLALFADEKLPGMFRYVDKGVDLLERMGDAAQHKDEETFRIIQKQLWYKIDQAEHLSDNLKRDLKAATADLSLMTPKYTLGVLAGEIEDISCGDHCQEGSPNVVVNIRYNKLAEQLQKIFDMGQKQTKKLLGDYGITEYHQTEYKLGDFITLHVHGTDDRLGVLKAQDEPNKAKPEPNPFKRAQAAYEWTMKGWRDELAKVEKGQESEQEAKKDPSTTQESEDETESDYDGERISCPVCDTVWYQDIEGDYLFGECEHLRFIYSAQDQSISYYGDWDVVDFEESIEKARQDDEDFDIEDYLYNIQNPDIDGTVSTSSQYYEEFMGIPFQITIWGYEDHVTGDGPLKFLDKATESNPIDIDAWLQKGELLRTLGRYDEAILAYDKAVEIDPLDADAWFYKAYSLQTRHRFDEAVQAYEKAIRINPGYSSWYNKSVALDACGKYHEAIQSIEEAIKLYPSDEALTDAKIFRDIIQGHHKYKWYHKGDELSKQGKYDEAIQAYEKAIEIDPEKTDPFSMGRYADALNFKGNRLYNQGNYDEAVQAYNKVISIKPTDAKTWDCKGKALACKGKYDEAIEAYDRAIELRHDWSTPWVDKGIALGEQGKYDKAIEVFDKIIGIDPQDASAWSNKGEALSRQGNYPEAIRHFDKAIEIDPRFEIACSNKGVALEKQGKYHEAVEIYDKVIELDKNNAAAWIRKGSALYELCKYDESVLAYDLATKLNPQDGNAWYNKGLALRHQGKYDKAIEAYERAIEIDPQDGDAWSSKGIAFGHHGKYDEAIEAFEKAIEIDPQDNGAWGNKGIALMRQGKYDEAIKAYDEAIRLDPNYAPAWENKGEAFLKQGRYAESLEALNRTIDLDPNRADAWNNKGEVLKALGHAAEADAAFAKAKELGYMSQSRLP